MPALPAFEFFVVVEFWLLVEEVLAAELLAAGAVEEALFVVVELLLLRRLVVVLELSLVLDSEERDSFLLELVDDEKSELESRSSSSLLSSAVYSRAHLESLITSCRLPLTLTASTESGIDQLEA